MKVCVTAEHRDQLDSVLNFFQIVPDYDLDIMKESQTFTTVTRKVLTLLEEVYRKEQPDVVLVQGDALTTFAASLAAFFLKIPIGHVEVGLRTGNKYSPFPEEMDRQLTGLLADLHFAPTSATANNLLREGEKRESIYVTGNPGMDTMADTVRGD